MEKVIKDFNIDTSDISLSGASKSFIITGDTGAKFSLFATQETSNTLYYYNFTTKAWQLGPTELNAEMVGNSYKGVFDFPAYNGAIDINIFLLADAESNTVHAPYIEVLDSNNNIDINASSGSNSLMLRKTFAQIADGVLTIRTASPNTAAGFVSAEHGSDTFRIPVGNPTHEIPFSITVSAQAGSVLKIDRQPLPSDFFYQTSNRDISAFDSSNIIQDEDPFDAGQTARSTGKTVDGAVTNSSTITMDDDVGSFWVVGDRVTGNTELDAKTGVNAVTITAINVGSNAKVFTVSEAVTISDGETLNFTEPYYYRWSVDNTTDLAEGSTIVGTNAVTDSVISPYRRFETIFPDTPQEQTITTASIDAITNPGMQSVTSLGKIDVIVELGQIVFNLPQPLLLAGDTVQFYNYGPDLINSALGNNGTGRMADRTLDIELTNLKAEMTKPVISTTAAVVNSTSVPVNVGHGVMDDVSTLSSINMDSSVADPTVTNIAGYSSTTATLTLSSAQTLENGESITVNGSCRTITITGNIKVNNMIGSQSIFLDVEKFVTGVTIF